MIASISGLLVKIDDLKIVVVQAGIGFEMLCPTAMHLDINQPIQLQTYLHWSQENGPSLYGFQNAMQKDLFLLLIDCQGIGPKLGISILQQTEHTQLLQMITQADMQGLSKIKGLGAKKAEVVCMHLKDKVLKIASAHPQLTAATSLGVWNDLQATLTSLHYSTSEIKQATTMVKESLAGQTVPFDLLLRKALTVLAKK